MREVKLNFGYVKNAYNTILAESMSDGDKEKKKIFSKYVKSLKESKILKDLFMVHTNIENKVEENEYKASEFVKANVETLSKYSKDEIKEAILDLSTHILWENADISDYENSKLKELHENINNLILLPKDAKHIDMVVESMSNVVEYIRGNKGIEVVNEDSVFPNSILSNIAVDKYNETYGNLSEEEKKVVKTILESDEKGKEEMFKTLCRECIDLIDGQLVEGVDVDTKDKLLQVKDRILRKEFDSDGFISEVSKLIELKNDLSE